MESIVNDYISRIENAVELGKLRSSNLPSNVLDAVGMSQPEVRILLNELVKEDINYLEIGINRGSTFVAAMYNNKPKSSFAIDHFGGPMYATDVKDTFLKNCNDNNVNNFKLIHNDSFKLTKEQKSSIKDINLYFYDGGHNTQEHKMALTYYYENLADVFMFIVDDWVHPPAVEGTKAALNELNLTVCKEWTLGHSQRIRNNELSWHNGLCIFVLKK